jgi:adsorption protein B
LCIWITLNGLDDLFLDLASLWRWLVERPQTSLSRAEASQRRLAILVPCWHEHEVIGAMLEHNLTALSYANYEIFAGAYPNDPATIDAIRAVERKSPRVHLSICPHPGPTSKADCLNWAIQHLQLHEETHGVRFDGLIVHDAEDLIHPQELHWLNQELETADFIQVPVLALPTPFLNFTHGVYCDEFAEGQSKDLATRVFLGGFLPSCGVGTALSRSILDQLAAANANRIFEPGCLTEDYELGRKVFCLGGKQKILPVRWIDGRLAATREYFPRDPQSAIRQRTRWITGIALQSWDLNGWGGWRDLYWFWRDRKGLLGNPLTLVTNILFVAALCGMRFPDACHPWMALGLALQLQRMAVRAWFSGRLYGWKFALGAPLRIVWGNWINTAATFRAVHQFLRAKIRGEPLKWVKTAHAYPTREALMQHKRRLGEILVDLGYLTEEALRAALDAKPPAIPLGQYLVDQGQLTDEDRWAALSVQFGIETREVDPGQIDRRVARSLPRRVVNQFKVFPIQIAEGCMHLAASTLPDDRLAAELSRFTRLRLQFSLVSEGNLHRLIFALH